MFNYPKLVEIFSIRSFMHISILNYISPSYIIDSKPIVTIEIIWMLQMQPVNLMHLIHSKKKKQIQTHSNYLDKEM